MFSKKKEDSRLPDLPDFHAPENFSSNHRKDNFGELSSLPSFPDSPSEKGFSQEAIKGAVGSEDGLPELPQFPEEKKSQNMVEMEEWTPSTKNLESATHISGEPVVNHNHSVPKPSERYAEPNKEVERTIVQHSEAATQVRKNEREVTNDVFVKIDKFHAARKTLKEVTAKLEEIDLLIKKIRDTKLREEQELSMWEKDIIHTRARIKGVTENIFEKVD